jgi:hypothetical protein
MSLFVAVLVLILILDPAYSVLTVWSGSSPTTNRVLPTRGLKERKSASMKSLLVEQFCTAIWAFFLHEKKLKKTLADLFG